MAPHSCLNFQPCLCKLPMCTIMPYPFLIQSVVSSVRLYHAAHLMLRGIFGLSTHSHLHYLPIDFFVSRPVIELAGIWYQ